MSIIIDAFLDSAKTIPWLFGIYLIIELVEYGFGEKIRKLIEGSGKSGPLFGAFLGIFPQCGFSVLTTALYSQRLATIGTLLAVYLSTSDEAIPIILSQPEKSNLIWPLLLVKFLIALFFGFLIDFVFLKKNKKIFNHMEAYNGGYDDKDHHHESISSEKACCGHSLNGNLKKFNLKEIIIHPIFHTLKIFSFIFIITLFFAFIIRGLGESAVDNWFSGLGFFQPFLAALIGLIPNCASSVMLAEFYLKGAMTFGSVIAGLCASGGLGIIVLFKEEKNKKEAFKIISLLFGISVFMGLIFQVLQ